MGFLLVIFVVVPAVELALLIEVGGRIGASATLLLIVVTGIAGAALARSQGTALLRRIQAEMEKGRMPGKELIEGAMVLVAGAVLITPGFLTDALGVLCLLPPTRRLLMLGLEAWLRRGAKSGRSRMTFTSWNAHGPGDGKGSMGARGPGPPPGSIKDADFEVREDSKRRHLE